jgi:hypothetical protein
MGTLLSGHYSGANSFQCFVHPRSPFDLLLCGNLVGEQLLQSWPNSGLVPNKDQPGCHPRLTIAPGTESIATVIYTRTVLPLSTFLLSCDDDVFTIHVVLTHIRSKTYGDLLRVR